MFQFDKYNPETIEKLVLTITSGCFLTFCLFAYQAYNIQDGLSTSGHSLLFRAIVFGLFVSLTFGINEYFIRPIFKSYLNIVVWRIWEIWLSGIVTFLWFNYFWNWQEWYFFAYFQITIECTGILIIPISSSYFLRKYIEKNRLLEHTKLEFEAQLIHIKKERQQQPNSQITFEATNGKTQLSIAANDFLYAISADNYVQIFYLINDEIKQFLLRSTLKTLEQRFPDLPFMRCHRSYFINCQNIIQIKKNSTKTFIQLKHIDELIPVSKKYEKELFDA